MYEKEETFDRFVFGKSIFNFPHTVNLCCLLHVFESISLYCECLLACLLANGLVKFASQHFNNETDEQQKYFF